MTKKETTSGGALWRKRAVATVGVAAAVAAGSVGFASSSDAAPTPARTNPTVTVTAPKTLANDGTGSGLVTVEVNNSATGNRAIPGTAASNSAVSNTASISFTITLPAGVDPSQVSLVRDSGNTTPAAAITNPEPNFQAGTVSGTPPTVTYTVANYTQPINTDYKYGYQLGINSVASTTPTGTVTTSANLSIKDGVSNNVNSISSAAATTTLTTPAAATFSTVPTSGGIIYQRSTSTIVTSFGTPTTSDFRAFGAPIVKNSDGTYPDPINRADNSSVANPVTGVDDAAVFLENGFYFDTVTGELVNTGNQSETNSNPAYQWTIIANNGEGGADTTGTTYPVAGVGAGSTAQPTPTTDQHDVFSSVFTLPVLFSDVTTTSPLAGGVYGLSNDGDIKGFFDGTFRPGQAVTRQEFVNILYFYLDSDGGPSNGECSTINPSAFSDVPNASPFCEAIKQLSQRHILNGTGGGKFSPSAIVTRQQITAITYRANAVATTGNVLNGDAKFTSPSPFSDVTASNPFGGDIEWAAKNKIVNGYTDGTFRPGKSTTRDAAAAVIFRTDLQGLVSFQG